MGDRKRVSRRVFPTHIYDYNYKVSEGYYTPQKQYMESSTFERERYSPPKHRSYAERYASDPWFGKTRGCPHRTGDVVLDEILSKGPEVRSRSNLFRDEKKRDYDFPPLSSRLSRRRKSELEDDDLGIRPRLARNLSYDSSDKPRLHPRYKDIGEKLRSLDAELARLAPRRSSVTEDSYSLPSGTSIHKSSRTEVSNYDSSRPPVSPRVRKISFNEDFAQPPPRPRGRISSVGDLPILPRSRRSSITDDDDVKQYASKAGRLRDERRLKESREITEGINNMIEKMRANKFTVEDGYLSREEKGIRKSKADPKVKEEQKSYANFAYGTSRKF